ncbi:MAG: arginyltransferase [Pseudomonadota bacterium]
MKLSDSHIFPPGLRRSLRFYLTAPAPCPYLPGKTERKAFTNLALTDADSVHDSLSQSGFRRSQSIAYRPACPNCNACRSVRIDVQAFKPGRTQRRILRANKDLVRSPARPVATREQFRLLKAYLRTRHEGGGMSDMNFRDYAGMVGDSPVRSVIFEYRQDDQLVACSITDVLRDGLSMVYTFFGSDEPARSLGTQLILDHVDQARMLGLPHVYLGYWVKGSPKMDYKRRFSPLEVLDGDTWRPMTDQD